MDPNETLRMLRALTATILLLSSPDPLALQMAELVDDLDEWLTRGDFLPDSWAPSTTHA